MIQYRWIVLVGALALGGGVIAYEARDYARFGDCATPTGKAQAVAAWRERLAASAALESEQLGGSRYAAAKAGLPVEPQAVEKAAERLRAASARYDQALRLCAAEAKTALVQVAE